MVGRTLKLTFGMGVLLIGLSCSRSSDEDSSATWRPEDQDSLRPIAVEGIEATRSILINEIRGAGIVEGIREAWVVSETEGLIKDVRFNLGDRVAQGQILLQVDDGVTAQNLAMAEQQYETALLEHQAAEKSKESGFISALQFSQVTDRLFAAEAAVATASLAFKNTRLKAPFPGSVAARARNLGMGNYLGRGLRVVRIVDDSAFQVEIGVGEGEILLIQENATARITGSDGVERMGRVSAVSAGSDGSTGSFAVVVKWIPEPGDPLKSGMSVGVAIQAVDDAPEVIIPASIIRYRGDKAYVYVDSAGIAEMREIQIGARLGERIEVLKGLTEGETLVASGLASVTEGAPLVVTLVGPKDDNP